MSGFLPAVAERATAAAADQRPASTAISTVARPLTRHCLQRKLIVGSTHDPAETEADRWAASLGHGSPIMPKPISAGPSLGSAASGTARAGRNSAASATAMTAPATVETAVAETTGAALDPGLRAELEPHFGADFSQVRVHTGDIAASSAQAVSARAYTVGHDIVFNAGAWAPHTVPGRALLAHELTHVVQQRADHSTLRRVSVSQTIARAFGGGTFPKAELDQYLAVLAKGSIEDNFDSDNKARAVIRQNMHIGKGSQIQALLLREMLSGHVSAADESGVVALLRTVTGAELRGIINYYNDHVNNRTGKGLVEDLRDALSELNMTNADAALAAANLEANTVEKTTAINSAVPGAPGSVWVGLIVRGKWSVAHAPGVMDQHADVVIPDVGGAMRTRGYFGDQPGATGSSAGSRATLGLDIPGVSADMDWFLKNRRQYVDLALAKLMNVKSTLVLVSVTKAQAATLNSSWDDLKKDPGAFYILGHNCSTAAAAGFEKAAIAKEISGLDTPDHLFDQLKARYPAAFMISGYYGYTRTNLQWALSAGEPHLINPGTGPWQGPFVVEKRLK